MKPTLLFHTILRKEKGLTLLEVLLSILLLTIILVTVMNFFPQMGLMNKQNETKQQAINLAKKELLDWQKKGPQLKSFLLNPTSSILPGYNPNYEPSDTNFYYFTYEKDNLDVVIKIKKEPDLKTNPSKAHLIHIKLLNERKNTISETYGYIIYD